jgi:hypothetical protein
MGDFKRTFNINFSGLSGLVILLVVLAVSWWLLSFLFGIFSMSLGRALSYLFVFGVGYVLGEGA